MSAPAHHAIGELPADVPECARLVAGVRAGDRRTLARAIEYLNGVNSEIEAVIRAQWPSKAAPVRAGRPGSNA